MGFGVALSWKAIKAGEREREACRHNTVKEPLRAAKRNIKI
jgi:hypothetical protein